ncbi:NADPH-dependent F420 reductase [Variovorax defluvii]|uniref:NADPH-dependent F420 reductase n=1 Tax=Variovorax defluvii TaxID=913761 RepID=A0ABP8I8I6_9BURK
MDRQKYTIALLGGTGAEGSGIALRLARAGHRVIIGSRDADKAARACSELAGLAPGAALSHDANPEAAAAAQIVIMTVPHAGQQKTVQEVREQLAGKILVDATVPLVPPKVARVQLPEGGSAVAAVQRLLGDAVRVVSAFQNVSAHHLRDLAHVPDCDVLVCGDDPEARETVVGLAADMGLRAWHAGAIANSAATEALTSLLIAMNMRYKVPGGTGIRITGLEETAEARRT